MYSKIKEIPEVKADKFRFVLGIAFAAALYVMAVFMTMVMVSTAKKGELPIEQEILDVRTIRYPTHIELKFTSVTSSDEQRIVYMVRSLYSATAKETALLPDLAVIVDAGETTWNINSVLPAAMKPGIYEYQRAFTYRPKWAINEKVAKYPPLEFRICAEVGKECRM